MHTLNNPDLETIQKDYKGNIYKNGRFHNEVPHKDTSMWEIMRWRFLSKPYKQVKKRDAFKLQTIHDTSLLDNKKDVIIWLGHASFYIRVNRISCITDPCFFDIKLHKRKVQLPLNIAGLGNIDYLLVSHSHYDHLDTKSVKTLVKNNPDIQALVPLKMSAVLKRCGVKHIQEAGWYQKFRTKPDINIILLPTKHWSRRMPWDHNKILWGSYGIQTDNTSIYFAGDTAYSTYFKEISDLVKTDIALLPIGAYEPQYIMKNWHMNPEEAVQAFHDLKAKTLIPMHYGTYDLSDESLKEPLQKIEKISKRKLTHGRLEIVPIGKNYYI